MKLAVERSCIWPRQIHPEHTLSNHYPESSVLALHLLGLFIGVFVMITLAVFVQFVTEPES
jgi:hypothetical protein